MTIASDLKVKAVANWFGSDRMVAAAIAHQLKSCVRVDIPFAGGMSIVPYLECRQILANDLHRHVINLCRVIQDPQLGPALYRKLRRYVLHPDHLVVAQARCRMRETAFESAPGLLFGVNPRKAETDLPTPDLWWAEDYFVATWMGQGGRSGTKNEFNGCLSFRRDAGGGSSAVRFANAGWSIPAWRRAFRKTEFCAIDAFDFIREVKPEDGHGLYVDAPWPDDQRVIWDYAQEPGSDYAVRIQINSSGSDVKKKQGATS